MERIRRIVSADRSAYDAAKRKWDSIAKPLGSFGVLEEHICRLAAAQGTDSPDISKRCAVIMCGDHGVCEEGVTQCGIEVTAECAADIACGRSNVNAVAAAYGADVLAVDVGIASDVKCSGLLHRKVSYGTRNMTKGPAMTREEAEKAITAGLDIAGQLKAEGQKLIVVGEMGIGNTTSASAIASVLTGLPPEKVTGRGAGLSTEGLIRKREAVRRAIEVNSPDPSDGFDVLCKVGGLEIAAMTGLFLGGAYYRVMTVIDGVISSAAAALAVLIEPKCRDYMLASHCSGEPAGKGLLDIVGQRAVIDAGLRLGEGTGGLLLIPLLDGALSLYNNARRFDDTTIERYVELK